MRLAGKYLLPDSDTYFSPFFESSEGFQLDHLQSALKHVSPFDCAIDGGAHVGSWTLKMLEKFKTVWSIEPASDTFECLKRNIETHAENSESVHLINAALGASISRGSIVDDTTRQGNTGSRFLKEFEEGNIQIITIDSLCLEKLDFLKLDVEGFEYYALLGAEKTIKETRPTILIEEKGFGRRYDLQPFAASELLKSWGARCVTTIGKDHVFVF